MKVRDRVRELRVPDDSDDRSTRMSERVLFQAQRTPSERGPPNLLLPLGLIGLLLGGGLTRPTTGGGALPLAVVGRLCSVSWVARCCSYG